MNVALARLALRRSAPLGVVIAIGALLVIAASLDWAPPREWQGGGDVSASNYAREGIWTAGVLVIAPLLVHACAATVGRWRAGDVDWLAQAPLSRGAILFSTWVGHAAAAVLGACAVALAAELGARDGAPIQGIVAHSPAPHGAIVDESSPMRWTIAAAPTFGSAARARVGIVLVAGAQAAEVRLSVERRSSDGSLRRATTLRHAAGRTALEIDVPDGEGEVSFELAREGAGAILALDGEGVTWLAPRASAVWISLEIARSVGLALCAACALALGFGAWVSSGIATALVATLVFANWLADAPALDAWSPWAGVPAALELAGRGIGPAPATWSVWIGTAACVLIGLALARAELTTWRRAT